MSDDGRPNYMHLHPFGPILGWFSDLGLRRLDLPRLDTYNEPPTVVLRHTPATRSCDAALTRYFQGQPEDFAGVPLDLSGATMFQTEVWNAAREVGYGSTSTYGALAERLGRDKGAARAIGHALGQNPIAILVPCHRFVAANGDLVGYAAGLAWKEELLRLERSALC